MRAIFFFTFIFMLISTVSMIPCDEIDYNIEGYTAPGWGFVRDLFRNNFELDRDTGASLAVYHKGRLVVDLTGGWFDSAGTKPYDNRTLQLVFSTTKGIVAAAVALCVQRGLLDYDDLVIKYWPEYGQNGKENTTIAEIMSHRAGLPDDTEVSGRFLNWTAMIENFEGKKPSWAPGSAQGYHALSYGWLAGELVRRVDPEHRSVGQFIREELAIPLGVEMYVGLPSMYEFRVSPLLFTDFENLIDPNFLSLFSPYNEQRFHQAEIPAVNGITNAASLAKIYASFIGDIDNKTNSRILRHDILQRATATYKEMPFSIDLTLNISFPMSMGFTLYDDLYPSLGTRIFGHTG